MRFRQTENISCTTTMFSKILSVFAAATLITLIVSGAAWADQIVVGMAAMSSFNLPFWTALEKKYFADEGVDLKLVYLRGGTRAIQTLLSGDVQIATVGLSPIVQANEQGADLRVIASPSNTLPFTVFTKNKISSGEELKGKVFGISTFGSESDITVTFTLKEFGLARRQVKVIQAGGVSERVAGLTSGLIDATPMLQPGIAILESLGYYSLLKLYEREIPWIFSSVVVRKGFIDQHFDLARRIMRAYIRGGQYALSNPEVGKKILAKQLRLTEPFVIESTFKQFALIYPANARPSPEGALSVLNVLSSLGQKISRHNVEDYVNTQIVDSVSQEIRVEK